MAQKLNAQYGFSYGNLKVLLGGWNRWKEKNAVDPAGYPIEGGAGTPGAGGSKAPAVTGPGIVAVTPGSTPPPGTTP